MSPSSFLVTFVLVLFSRTVVESKGFSPKDLVVDLVGGFESKGYDQAFREIWGQPRKIDDEGQHVELSLDKSSSGGGFVSQDRLYHGFFSAAIKLPGDYSAGVVTAFYTSNQDRYPKQHDEFDLEFLGVRAGSPYVLQTNIYGNGSTDVGREERLHLWFDPTLDYHNYSILWNQYHTVFFVDNIPIREMIKIPELGLQYPSKPQSLYTTIWDGSQWATEGGKYPVDYSLAPFKAYFKHLKLEGCVWNEATDEVPPCASSSSAELNRLDGPDFKSLNAEQRRAMKWVRSNYLWYSYCDDVKRYPEAPVDCPPRAEGPQAGAASKPKSRKSKDKRKTLEH
ncbi:unnamed protein product [Calypogeia fissa]